MQTLNSYMYVCTRTQYIRANLKLLHMYVLELNTCVQTSNSSMYVCTRTQYIRANFKLLHMYVLELNTYVQTSISCMYMKCYNNIHTHGNTSVTDPGVGRAQSMWVGCWALSRQDLVVSGRLTTRGWVR